MKYSVLIDMLFELLSKRKLTARYLSEKHGLSTRTIYRYIELLSEHVPVEIKRGRSGGVYVADHYKLPVGFMTSEEYDAAIDALVETYARQPEERFLAAKRKLSAQKKKELRELAIASESGGILVCDERSESLSQMLWSLQESIQKRAVLNIRILREGTPSEHKIEPHALVFNGTAWRLYAFCHTERSFQNFAVNDLLAVFKTDATFRKRPFKKSEALK